MKWNSLTKATALTLTALSVSMYAGAQNKDVDKGNEMLKKAMEQTDAAKKQEMITKAKEQFQKGGLKPQEMNVIVGDAYLDKGDLRNAELSYNTASKEDKKIGLKKVAEAYVDQAFGTDDEKTMPKSLKKAMDLFGKTGDTKEGARMIGDRYYEKGSGFYDKALDYYLIGEATVKVEQIANTFFEKGGDSEAKAAETYMKLKTPAGYEKAGNIYYDRKEYQKAIDAYMAGSVTQGVKKYADLLYSQHRDEEADNLIVQLAGAYAEKRNEEALDKLAQEVQDKGSYALATKIFEKAGNSTLADKSRAYDALLNFRLGDAKDLFTQIGDAASAKAIETNMATLTALADLYDNFGQIKSGAPNINLITDSVTGVQTPSSSDEAMREDYYKSVKDQIIKNVTAVATNYAKLTDDKLKKSVRMSFVKFGAIRSILDKDTFFVKKQKQDVRTRDVIL